MKGEEEDKIIKGWKEEKHTENTLENVSLNSLGNCSGCRKIHLGRQKTHSGLPVTSYTSNSRKIHKLWLGTFHSIFHVLLIDLTSCLWSKLFTHDFIHYFPLISANRTKWGLWLLCILPVHLCFSFEYVIGFVWFCWNMLVHIQS